MKTFKPFTNGDLDDVLRNQFQQIADKIKNEDDNYLLNVNEDEYIDHLVSEFTINTPVLDFEARTASAIERMIPVEQHPNTGFFFHDDTKSFNRQVIIFHIPFSGDINVLDYAPNPRILWTYQLTHTRSTDMEEEICFEIINFSNDAETLKRESDNVIQSLTTQMGHVTKQIEGHNANLKNEVTQRLQERKKDLLNKSDFLSQLGLPIKKKDNLAETFSVPTPKIPKKIVPKPVASSTNPNPDPTLELTVYDEILQIIHNVGKVIERMPSTYKGKSEEDLRDHLLIYLEPRFEGSATGETFNKSGKTDILLRYENSNIFIAECKYWGGEKLYLETIDQILGYLTWRDSKSAIILFVKNADFSSVLQKVKKSTPSHPNYVKFLEERENTWLSYKVLLNGDAGRELYLTVLLFHFPEK